jgi:GT2 family glycosyltransferase
VNVSVVVRSRDEGDRLRLTLTSLSRQSQPAEVVVVNDGSRDHTRAVVDEAADWLPLTIIHHETPHGRSGASNAGARAATGDVLLFLDGDTLAGSDLVQRHAAAHSRHRGVIGRGEAFHLRCTRYLLDPETGTPRPGEEARVGRLMPGELDRLRVTRAQILEDFDTIARRAEPGIYPGAGPRQLEESDLYTLRNHPDCSILWAAATGSNLSVPRASFLEAGGFAEWCGITEHRELALRLCKSGLRMAPVDTARTYHLTHRSGWRDPLKEPGWEAGFFAAHPIPEVKLLALYWASFSTLNRLPAEARIGSLLQLEIAARGDSGIDYDAARARLGLPALAPNSGVFQ